VAAGCGDRTPAAPAGGDAGLLAGLVAVERELVRAWTAASSLPGDEGATARAVLAHERVHMRELQAALGRTAKPATAPGGVSGAARRVRIQAGAGDARGAMDAALSLEREAQVAYLDTLTKLRDPDRRALVMAIGAAEAQHASVVLAALGRDPLPDAFAGTVPA
jgi:hypothetical protein